MDKRTFEVLEFTKVLEHIAGFCISDAGAIAVRNTLPYEDVNLLHDYCALLTEIEHFCLVSRFKLTKFSDLTDFFAIFEKNKHAIDVEALWAVRQCLLLYGTLCDTYTEQRSTDQTRVENTWEKFGALLHASVTPVSCIAAFKRCLNDEGYIPDESSPQLAVIRSQLRQIHQQCTRKVREYAEKNNILHYLQDEFMSVVSDRYVLPFKTSYKNKMQGVIHHYSNTGETCYFEPLFLVELNNSLQELKKEERDEENKIIQYLIGLLEAEKPAILSLYSCLVKFDTLVAKNSFGRMYNGIIPSIAEDAQLCLVNARHPLLAIAESQGKQKVHPLQLELLQGQHGLLISGGNAGGKTVGLKCLGLIALMAFCGIPVPVEKGSTLPFWKHIFAFIGDEQSLDSNVSTFTAQIEHLTSIWAHLNKDSLIILDEFGAGTDPAEGAALAQAVFDEILHSQAIIVAATHFPALKAYALSNDQIRAASVLFDPVTKQPRFQLVYDQVGASRALDVAREHGLAESVLQKAEHYLLLGGEDSAALIDKLNTLAVEREKEIVSLKQQQQKVTEKETKLIERFEKERTQLIASVKQEAQTIVAEWKSGRQSAKQALKSLGTVQVALQGVANKSPEQNKQPIDFDALQVGQQARYDVWDKNGIVLEKDPKKKKIRLDFNGVSLWVNAKDISESCKQQKPKTSVQVNNSNNYVPFALDVRGMRADLAISELGKTLDSALLSSIYSLEVIHGRGTGALRKEIHSFLGHFPAVESYELAGEDYGGDGKTLVKLR